MKHRKFLSTLLALAILLSCVGWTPSRAEETMPDVQTEQSQAVTQTEAAVYTEQMSREELPEIVAQEAPLYHGHVGRLENEEQDNLNQFIFLNQDGTKTMYLYDHPVKYRDEDGNTHDISLNIADAEDTAYPFRTEANWAMTAFPRELANGITLEGPDAQIKMIPILPDNSSTVLNHMARRVDENTVAYTYDSATQLEYQLTYDGFKEEIVVREYTGQTEYHFFLYTNGLSLTQLDGGYYLTDEAGNIQGTIGDIIVFTADERNNTFGQLQAETVKENGIYLLTIVLDGEYLADPNTQYPIRIDPTVSLTYAESGADAIEDVLLQSGRDSLPEYGGHVIGKSSKGISRLLMRFPGIDFSALEGVTVTYATVSLRDLMCEEAEMPITCYPFTGSAWTESTADWSVTQQSWGTALSTHIISYDSGEAQPSAFRYFFEITSLAQQWVNGSADEGKGIILRSTDAVENSETLLYKTFASYERASYKPTFTITYTNNVTVTPSTAQVYRGESITLTADTAPDGLAVTWVSESPEIATVDENGLVTGISAGETTITASVDENTYAVCYVSVLPKSIVISGDSYETIVDGTVSISVSTIPEGQSITWSSSNPDILSHLSGGSFAARKAGVATVTATLTDGTSDTCTVRVVLKDGVYYIQNLHSKLYLHVENGGIANLTDVCQYPRYLSTVHVEIIRQMWKICYLGEGRYSVRPMHKPDMGLDVTSGNVDIYNIGADDTLSSVPSFCEWTIEWDSTGYVFKNYGSDSKTMQIKNASTSSGATVVASTYSTSTNCRWGLTEVTSPPAGVYLYDTDNKAIVTTTTRAVAVGTTKSLSTLQLSAVAYSGTNISQSFTWYSSNNTIATVDSNGAVTGVSIGKATITGRVYRNSEYHYVSYTINVSSLLIYQTENTYYYDANGNYADDLTCGDMTKDELRALDWISWIDFTVYTPALYRGDWEYMCTSLFSTGELQTVVLDMIDHFMDGTGSAYSNSVLTQKAYEHDSTQEYIKNVEEQLEALLNTYQGAIGELAYTANNRESNPFVMALKANNVYQPVYNTTSDKINGLTICVDGLWGNKIEVTSYNISGNSYSYTLHYTLYDHFGLDQADVEKYGLLAGFRSWYVLQHYSEYDSAYRPFLTMIEFDVTVSGTIS